MANRFRQMLMLVLYGLSVLQPITPIISFLIHQKEITDSLCENRMRPKLNCHGKCYLAKKLEEAQTSRPDPRRAETTSLIVFALLHLVPEWPSPFLPDSSHAAALEIILALPSLEMPPPVPPPRSPAA